MSNTTTLDFLTRLHAKPIVASADALKFLSTRSLTLDMFVVDQSILEHTAVVNMSAETADAIAQSGDTQTAAKYALDPVGLSLQQAQVNGQMTNVLFFEHQVKSAGAELSFRVSWHGQIRIIHVKIDDVDFFVNKKDKDSNISTTFFSAEHNVIITIDHNGVLVATTYNGSDVVSFNTNDRMYQGVYTAKVDEFTFSLLVHSKGYNLLDGLVPMMQGSVKSNIRHGVSDVALNQLYSSWNSIANLASCKYGLVEQEVFIEFVTDLFKSVIDKVIFVEKRIAEQQEQDAQEAKAKEAEEQLQVDQGVIEAEVKSIDPTATSNVVVPNSSPVVDTLDTAVDVPVKAIDTRATLYETRDTSHSTDYDSSGSSDSSDSSSN